MKHLSIRNSLLVAAAAGVLAVGAIVAACGGSNSSGNSSGGGTSSGTSSGGGGAGSCANPTVGISFSPMYSAFIPGSSQQQFQIPAITDDGNSATWTTTDTTNSVSMSNDPTTGGVMITLQGTGSNGTVTIIATESDGSCGVSTLNITTNTENDWQTGSARYNDGIALHVGGPAGGGGGGDGGGGGFGGGGFEGGFPEGGFHRPDGGGFFQSDGGSFLEAEGGVACTNCHGANSTSGLFTDVSHTPEQTGGFSDQDLIDIIVHGVIPDGGYFDPTVILGDRCNDGGAACTQAAMQTWHTIHQWNDITSDEYAGIVCYLRSLTPEPQLGTSNFGGGGHHRDGGGGGPGGGGSSSGTTSSSGGTGSSSGSSSGGSEDSGTSDQ